MGISEQIGDFYAGIEDKFYAGMDFLSDHGVPVYAAIDPLEDRGIPAFPIIIASTFIVLFLLYGLLFLSSSEISLTLSIKDQEGMSISGVSLELLDSNGKKVALGSNIFNDGQTITVPRGKGTKLTLEAEKNGYSSFNRSLLLNREEMDVSIRLDEIIVQLQGAIRLIDIETNDVITGAKIVARISDSAGFECFEEAKGIYSCPGVIQGRDTTLTIDHPNYEQKIIETSFESESENEIQMLPKASASSGKSNLIVRIFDSVTRERIGNFTLKVYDSVDNEIITELKETDGDGELIEKISKGTSIRIVVEKENYLTYDSSVLEENITLRSDEEIREVYLRPGTNALSVGVLDVTGRPLITIDVTLFNQFGEVIGTQTTGLAGEVAFENLSTDSLYFVSAWDNKSIPVVQEVLLSETNRVNLVLERATANNSGTLTVYTTNEDSEALNDVTLNFFEDSENLGLIPLGVPSQKTDLTGKYDLLAPLNKDVVIFGTKDNLEGEDSIKILDTFQNEAFIVLVPPFSQVNLAIIDNSGNEVSSGFLTVIAGNDILFEGEYESGGVTFNPRGNNYVQVTFTDEEGNVIEEEIYVEGLENVSVNPQGKTGSGTNPELEFQGIFNIDGTEAQGLAKGIDYFLKFRVNYPEGTTSNGIHVRLGDDSIKFVDSQDAGIIGFSAAGATAFYGRTYTAVPEPGFEALDFSNRGEEGSFNKFTELYFTSGGEKIVKIRVKAKDTAATGEIPLHFRAWTEIGNMNYRTPEDPDLGLEEYSSVKTGLYADTIVESLKILETSASCSNEFCASYAFIREDGSEFSVDNFQAVLGEIYALEVNLAPNTATNVTLKASTVKKKPKIGFQGFTINDFTNFPDSNSTDTSLQVDNVSALDGESTTVRLYFKPYTTENSSVTLQLISGETVLNEQFYFEIYEEKNLTLKTIPSNVVLGEDFVILVEEANKAPIENAQIKLSNESGQHLETIQGNGSASRGGNGRYSVVNSFDAGILLYEVSAPRFKPLRGSIDVTKEGAIEWAEDEIFVVIRKDTPNTDRIVELINNSKQNIGKVSFDIEPIGSLPQGMTIEVAPLSNLPANSAQRVIMVAQYNGESETSHGEARITARARTETGFTVIAETKVIIDFNPEISAECVSFSKNKLAIFVASGYEDRSFYDSQFGTLNQTDPTKLYRYNNFTTTSSESFTATLANTPECQGVELELRPEIIANGKKEEGLEVEADVISLAQELETFEGERRKDIDEITISVTNNILRNYPGKQRFKFDIIFKTDGFEKSIPVDVFIWNPRYALQVTRNIELFLGPNDRGQFAAQAPLFVRNVGEAMIENIDFRISTRTSRGNVDIRIEPNFPIQFLNKGQSIIPPKTIVAQALRNEKTTLLDVKELDITGVIDGRTFSFGPVIITSHISADQCLIATTSNVLFFSTKSNEGAISREIKVRNTCAEEVRIIDVSQPPIGNNNLRLTPNNVFIPPGASSTFDLILEKREDFQGSPVPVYIKGFLPRSGSPIDSSPIVVDIKLGKSGIEDAKLSNTVSVEVCETGETREVQFPVIATSKTALCDNSYCDAVQLSNYLADRIDQQIKTAERQVAAYQGQLQPTTCDQANLARGFCEFSEVGVREETFNVYLQHDSLSPELMDKALKAKSGSISSYKTTFLSGDSGGNLLGGFSRQIFLNDSFRGCGRYTVTLKGSVKVQSSRLIPDLMNVVVDITPNDDGELNTQTTSQCLPKIQNISNFLPVDKDLTLAQKQGAWVGAIDAGPELLSIANDVSKEMFGTDTRVKENVSGTNTLELTYGNDGEYIVRIEMDKTISTSPITITAAIKQDFGGDEAFQTSIAKEAAKAISNLRDNEIDGCIGEDESYFLLKSAGDFGKIALTAAGTIPVTFNQAACTEITITSPIRETVLVEGRQGPEGLEIAGIDSDSPFFYLNKEEKEGNNDKDELKIKLEEFDEKDKLYKATAFVCVEGDSDLHLAQGKKIRIIAERLVGKAQKTDPIEVLLAVQGIHPIKFITEKIPELKITDVDEFYYATFVWKGKPDPSFDIKDLEKLNDTLRATNEANTYKNNPNREIAKEEPQPVKDAKFKAANYYLGTCAAVSIGTSALRPIIGLWAGVFNATFDCLFPYMVLTGEELPFGIGDFIGNFKELIDNLLGGLGTFIKGVGSFFGAGINAIFNVVGLGSITEQLKDVTVGTPEDVPREIADAFALQALIKDNWLAYFQTFGGKFDDFSIIGRSLASDTAPETVSNIAKNLSKSRVVGDAIAEEIVKEIRQKAFGNSANATVVTFTLDLKDELSKNIGDAIAEAAKEKSSLGRGGILTSDELKNTIEEAVSKTTADPDILTKFSSAKTHLVSTQPLTKAINIDELAKEVTNDIKEKVRITDLAGDDTIVFNSSPTQATIIAELDDKTDELIDAVIDRFEAETSTTIRGTPLENRLLSGSRLTSGGPVPDVVKRAPNIWSAPISESASKRVINEAERKILAEVEKSALGDSTSVFGSKFVTNFDKKFVTKAASALAEDAKEKIRPDKALPKFWGKGGIQFLKNLLKEGAFGVLANVVGLKMYDHILEKELDKLGEDAKFSNRAQELVEAGGIVSVLADQVFVSVNPKITTITKYQTYRIQNDVDSLGNQNISFELAPEGIPKETGKDFLLNDPNTDAFNETLEMALPGLIPRVTQLNLYPEPFKATEKLQDLHIDISHNYLKKQKGNVRYGVIIASVIESEEERFAKENINLEALLTTIGIVKSGLGIDPKLGAQWMFGCGFGNQVEKEVPENARCAIRGLVAIQELEVCANNQNKAECYFTEYNKLPNVQSKNYISEFIREFGETEFGQIYKTWNKEYAWRAS